MLLQFHWSNTQLLLLWFVLWPQCQWQSILCFVLPRFSAFSGVQTHCFQSESVQVVNQLYATPASKLYIPQRQEQESLVGKGCCCPGEPSQTPLLLSSLQSGRGVRMRMARADSQISGCTSIGPALVTLCLLMEVDKHLHREPGPLCCLSWFLNLNPNGMTSEILKYCGQSWLGFFPTYSFWQQLEAGVPKSPERACFLWLCLANSGSLRRSDNHPYLAYLSA